MGGKTAGTTEFHKQFKVIFQEIFHSEHPDLGAVEELCLMEERLFLGQEDREVSYQKWLRQELSFARL